MCSTWIRTNVDNTRRREPQAAGADHRRARSGGATAAATGTTYAAADKCAYGLCGRRKAAKQYYRVANRYCEPVLRKTEAKSLRIRDWDPSRMQGCPQASG